MKPGKRLLSAKDMGSVVVSIMRGEGCWGERLEKRFQGWSTLGTQTGEGVSDDAVSCGGMHDVAVRVV